MTNFVKAQARPVHLLHHKSRIEPHLKSRIIQGTMSLRPIPDIRRSALLYLSFVALRPLSTSRTKGRENSMACSPPPLPCQIVSVIGIVSIRNWRRIQIIAAATPTQLICALQHPHSLFTFLRKEG